MQAVTRNSLRDLDRRMGVSTKVLGLLSRATGLALLSPDKYVHEVTELRHPSEPLGMGESNQGIDFLNGDGTSSNLRRVVLKIEEVRYPIAGYPEAYSL